MTKNEYLRKRELIMMEMEEHIPSQEIAILFARRIADLEDKYNASKRRGKMKTKIDRQELSALPVMGEIFYRCIDPKKISAYTAGIKGKKFSTEQAIMVWPKTETAEKVYCVRRIS